MVNTSTVGVQKGTLRARLMSLVSLVLALVLSMSMLTISAAAAGLKDSTFKLTVVSDVTAFTSLIESDTSSSWGARETTFKAGEDGSGYGTYGRFFKANGSSFTFYGTVFDKLDSKCQQDFISSLMSEMKGADFTSTGAQQITDGLSGSGSSLANLLIPFVYDDLGADMATAYKWMAPILSVLRVVFGVLAIVVLLALVLSTILDCVYIGLPTARDLTTKSADGSEGAAKKPTGVSYDAFKTIMETEGMMTGEGKYKNPFLVYFKRRATTYIILALCLFYLVAGEMSGLISWLLSLVSGITG